MARRLAFNIKTLYLFICNYNVIILIWAAMGTICAKRSTHQPFASPLYTSPSRSLNDTRTMTPDAFLGFPGFHLQWEWMDTLKSFSLSAVWVLIVALGFSISNQRQPTSIREDSVNKPWRPLPSQRITPSQASTLLVITSIIGLLFSSVFGGLVPYLLQLAASYHYNDLGGAQGHHAVRDLLNGIGMTAWLFGCMDVAGGPGFRFSNSDLATSVVLTAAIATTIAIQDFRDLDGDSKCGRATLPIVLGHKIARVILATSILVWSFGIAIIFELRLVSALSGLGILIALRLILLQNRSADKVTLEFWFGWFATLSLAML
jgi:4-hydroxybenzoate polyprenyltransferase